VEPVGHPVVASAEAQAVEQVVAHVAATVVKVLPIHERAQQRVDLLAFHDLILADLL